MDERAVHLLALLDVLDAAHERLDRREREEVWAVAANRIACETARDAEWEA
jgi:hypothetical protein